jgi:hypothetical protein
MKLPAPDEMTEADHAAVAKMVAQADGLAERIMSAPTPDVRYCKALSGLVAFARGSGLFSPAPRHLAALERLPPAG